MTGREFDAEYDLIFFWYKTIGVKGKYSGKIYQKYITNPLGFP